MAFAVVLFFDAPTEARVRGVARGLVPDGIPADPYAGELRPHVSLGVCEDLDTAGFRAEFMAFAAATPPRECMFGSVGVFPTGNGGVVFLAPVVTYDLLSLHQDFFAVFARYAVAAQDYYLPGNWVPHCTLALNVPRDRLGTVVDTTSRTAGLPFGGRFESIGLIQFVPLADVYTARLEGSAKKQTSSPVQRPSDAP